MQGSEQSREADDQAAPDRLPASHKAYSQSPRKSGNPRTGSRERTYPGHTVFLLTQGPSWGQSSPQGPADSPTNSSTTPPAKGSQVARTPCRVPLCVNVSGPMAHEEGINRSGINRQSSQQG